MGESWTKLHSKMFDSEWATDYKTNYLFIFLISKANFEDKKWRGIIVKRGELITSVNKLSQGTGLTVRQVRTALDKLKSTNNLTNKTTNKYSLITITNYNYYQSIDKQPDKQMTNKRQTNDKQMTTTKEEKNKRKEEKTNKKENPGFENFWSAYGKIGNKQQALKSYERATRGGANHDDLINGLERYQTQCRANGTEQRFIKHASTWLNNLGWEDEYPIYESSGGGGKSSAHDSFTQGYLDFIAECTEEQQH